MTTATPLGKCSVKLVSPQPDHLARVELAKIDGLGDVAVGFSPGFAAFINLPCGQLEPPFPQDRGRFDQDGGPVANRSFRPCRESRPGRGDRLTGLHGPSQGDAADDL
jgi:hypothetical protein